VYTTTGHSAVHLETINTLGYVALYDGMIMTDGLERKKEPVGDYSKVTS
jgi:hypothetical protein